MVVRAILRYHPLMPFANASEYSTTPPTIWSDIHRDSDKRLQNKSKSGHEERVLATQKCLVGGGNGRAFDARYLLDF